MSTLHKLIKATLLTLCFITSLSAGFVSPYGNISLQSAEERLKKTTLKSVELQEEIARKKAIEKAKREEAQKIEDAKIAKNFASKDSLKKIERVKVTIQESKDIKFKPAPDVKNNAPVDLEDASKQSDADFF
ncbi:MAG: hypothetical protein Q9M43_11970 [Sulfurimonas sp.]|nr:hypothetical protein [Sulfurimonas sp.]